MAPHVDVQEAVVLSFFLLSFLSLEGTKSYLLKRLRAAPDSAGGREYGGQSVPRGVSQYGRKP